MKSKCLLFGKFFDCDLSLRDLTALMIVRRILAMSGIWHPAHLWTGFGFILAA